MTTQKPDLTRVWAEGAPSGNVVDPDTTSPGKFNAGWLAEVPPFEHFNFLQKLFTQGLAHFNEQGIGVWDADTIYPINGLAKGSNGKVYIAIAEQSGNNPVNDNGTNWSVYLTLEDPKGFTSIAELASASLVAGQTAIVQGDVLSFNALTMQNYLIVSDTTYATLQSRPSDVALSNGNYAILQKQPRIGKGVVNVDSLTGFRFGNIAYSIRRGSGKLLTDLGSVLPSAKMLDTSPYKVTTQRVVTSGSWSATGNPNVFRTQIANWDFDVSGLPAFITFDNGESLNSVGYPNVDSVNIYNSGSFLNIDVYQASGISPTGVATVYIQRVDGGNNDLANKIFVDPVNGNDGYDGKSWEYPYKTINAAITDGADIVVLKDGVYKDNNNVGVYTAARDLSVICPEGKATIVSNNVTYSSWTLESGNVYYTDVAGVSTPVGVGDLTTLDEFGNPTTLVSTTSIAECQSTPGSFFYDAGFPRRMYCHLTNGNAPDDDLVIPLTLVIIARHSAPGQKVYFEGVTTVGGSGGGITVRDTDVDATLIAKDCVCVGSNKNGFDILDVGLCLTINCQSAYNANDGINYTAFNSISPHFIEINHFGYRNKELGTGNGSTSHDDCVGFRINCDYFDNNGPGMADTGNAITWNVNIVSTDNATYGVQSANDSTVTVDGLSAFGNITADVIASNNGVLSVRNDDVGTYSGSILELI